MILIIDLSSMLHQVSKNTAKLTNSKGISTGHIYSFLKKIPKIKEMNVDLVIFCLDGGHKFRNTINPDYKANRNSKTIYYVTDVLEFIKNMPVLYCIARDREADDLLFTLSSSLNEDVILFSKDYDLSYTLVNYPKVRHIFNFEQEITPTSLFMRFGCYPKLLPLYKSIFGDVSDNIKGIKLNRKKKEVIKLFSKNDYSLILPHLKDHAKTVLKNFQTIRLRMVSNIVVARGYERGVQFEKLLEKYEIKSLNAEDLLYKFPCNERLLAKVINTINE